MHAAAYYYTFGVQVLNWESLKYISLKFHSEQLKNSLARHHCQLGRKVLVGHPRGGGPEPCIKSTRLFFKPNLIGMSGDENHPPPSGPSRKRGGSALRMGPRKKATSSNSLILHGRHFDWTVFVLCNYPALLTSGILRLEELQDSPLEDFPADVRREHRVFMELVDSYPGLLDRLTNDKEEDIIHVGELISLQYWKLGKGASGARGDDTKALKSAMLEWLVPRGQPVIPPLSQNIKSDRGFNHEASIGPMQKSQEWLNHNPWKGLLRSEILVFGFKHVFTSPSSVEREPKATRSGNAYLHGMKSVTKGSLAYIATQVQFLLCSSSVFSHTDTVTDSENFYHSILDLLEDPDESKEVVELMTCWIFPNSSSAQRSISKNSALSKIQEKCAALQAIAGASIN
ncbi:hypothetical protein EV424DRAFT_1354099 [Suillus variegatus]|nr:hypothetical protein EV424DRAFT_1354099 [Suillus variegatus]